MQNTCAIYDEGTNLRVVKNGVDIIYHKIGLGAEYIDDLVTLHDASGRTTILDAECCAFPLCDNGQDLQEKILEMIRRPYPVLTNFQEMIRKGRAYSICHYFPSIPKNAERNILFEVGSDLFVHAVIYGFIGGGALGGQAYIYLSENPSIITLGSPLSIININRELNPIPISQETAYHTNTYETIGTQLCSIFIPPAVGKQAIGDSELGVEYILGRNKSYLLRIVNVSDTPQIGGFTIYFYEDYYI